MQILILLYLAKKENMTSSTCNGALFLLVYNYKIKASYVHLFLTELLNLVRI